MNHTLIFDAELIKKYDTAGPRYTSYPTAVQFHTDFSAADYCAAAAAANAETALRPLSLYFHIPFCDTLCFYCGCNKIATKNRAHAVPYLEHLHREIALQSALFDRRRVVDQLHWGGGTPTFISHAQMEALMDCAREHFTLREDDTGEYSIEIDPREVKEGTLAVLRRIGFNRLSMGVQDFDPRVQAAVNRIQSEAETFAVLEQARSLGFRSINLDLIYGLPHQSVSSFLRTLDKVIAASPDRLSVFNYAHLPELFKPQRRINAVDLPSPNEKLAILQATIAHLADAGYIYIGMDHFAKPDDELARAQRAGTLYRNFQGYSTHSNCDLVAMGTSSISSVGNTYAQNVKTLQEYAQTAGHGQLPIFRGITLDDDDVLRRDVITKLICHFELDMAQLGAQHGVDFTAYFAPELHALDAFAVDGLVRVTGARLEVLPPGRLLIRNVCMIFDRYLRQAPSQQRYSKVI